jgi:hypothetical protein
MSLFDETNKAARQYRRDAGCTPATFNRNPQALTLNGVKLESSALVERMARDAEQLRPADAVRLAQRLLVGVDDFGIGYADFQSAQAVQKYVRQAIRALRGLSLT